MKPQQSIFIMYQWQLVDASSSYQWQLIDPSSSMHSHQGKYILYYMNLQSINPLTSINQTIGINDNMIQHYFLQKTSQLSFVAQIYVHELIFSFAPFVCEPVTLLSVCELGFWVCHVYVHLCLSILKLCVVSLHVPSSSSFLLPCCKFLFFFGIPIDLCQNKSLGVGILNEMGKYYASF